MHSITIPSAIQVVEHVVVKLNQPVFFWGGFGGGKSSMVAQAAAKIGAVVVDIRLSQYDSVDLRGFPGVQDGETVWYAPATLPFVGVKAFEHIPDTTPIILFFDEANAASNAVSAVAYQLVNDRACGEHKLRDNVRIIMAGNREGDRGVTNRQPAPLSNRLTHFEVISDVPSVVDYAMSKGWPAIFAAFINFRKPLLNTAAEAKPTDKAIATPRSWEKAMTYYADSMPEDIKMAAMAGAIGEGPAAEFWGFVSVWQKVKDYMPKITKNPEKCDIPEEPSMLYAVTVSVSGEMTPETAPTYHKFLMRLSPEFAILAWQLAVKRDEALYSTREFIDFSKTYAAVLK